MNGNHHLVQFLTKVRLQRAFLRYLTILLLIVASLFLVSTSGSVRGQSPTPTFAVRHDGDNVNGWDWLANDEVIITIDGSANFTAPTDEWGYFDLNLDGAYDIVPDTHVAVTDGSATKDHIVTNLTITNVDVDTEMVYGTATPDAQVNVWACWEDNCANRWEMADGTGSWMTDFSIPGDEVGEELTYDIGPGTWVDSGEWDGDGDNTNAGYNVPNPYLEAQPENDWVNGWQWDEGATINLSIDDPTVPGSPDYTDSQIAYVPDWDPNQTIVEFNLQGVYDLKAGDIVQLTDSAIIKTHIVANLIVTDFDLDADTLSGAADPDAWFDIWAHDDCCWNLQVQADAIGDWTADLSQFGYDLRPGSDGAMGLNDDDGDQTWVGWHIPNPTFAVRPDGDNIDGWEWLPDTELTITLNGYVTNWHTDEWGNFGFSVWDEFDIIPGTYVEVTDGVSYKDHTVTNLTITSVDVDTDVVTGAAGPNSPIQVWTDCGEHGCVNRSETADENGDWVVDFSVPGGEGEEQTADIQPGSWVDSGEWDEDGDNTNVGYNVPNPYIDVFLGQDSLQGTDWTPHATVNLMIDDPGGDDYADAQVADEWGNVHFNLWDVYHIQPGQIVTLSDGTNTRIHTVIDLRITEVDPENDTVSGTTDWDIIVHVSVHNCDCRVEVDPVGGVWIADFSGIVDLVSGTDGWAEQRADGGETDVNWDIPNPTFAVRLFDDQVEGWEWPLGTDVTMTIDDPDTPESPDYEDMQTVVVADWDPNQTHVQFDFNYVYFIEPGHVVILSDGEITKTHTVLDLSITDVDEIADTVSGTAVPDSQVDAWICEHWGCANRHVMADSAGDWTADFASPGPQDDEQETYDIVAGTSGDISQSDEDGDNTQIWWNISDPRVEVSYEHNWIQISGFTPDGQVTYTIYDYEGGHALFGPVTGPVDPHGNGWIHQNLFHTDLVPGMYVMAVDETTGEEVSLLIREVNLDYVGIDDDRAFGTAEPNTTIEFNISKTHDDGFNLMVDVDGNGYWEVDLATAGYPIDEYRYASAYLYDAEGDNVMAQNPRLHARVSNDHINVDNFSKNADVTLTLYDSPGGTPLYGLETHRTDGDGNASVNLWDYGIDLLEGHTVVAYDHTLGFTKTLEIELFTLDEMNTADDTLRGTSYVGEWVNLHVESLFSNWGQDALTDETGHWFADYANEGYDITEQMWASGWAVDNQGNWSHDHTTGFPGLEASPTDDWISGWNFSPDRPVRITIFASEGGDWLAEAETMADGNTQFHMDYDQHGVDLQAGMYIFVEDIETGKTTSLTLVHLTFNAVDYDADTASGQAISGTSVVVSADWLFDHYELMVTADPTGHWFADFAVLGADITPEWGLRAKVYDMELDATVADAPQLPHFTASVNENWISGNNWTGNDTVYISVYEFDGGPILLNALDWETDPYGNFHASLGADIEELQPGYYVVIHDNATGQEKALTLADLSIAFVDFDQDIAGGLAPAETRLNVGFGNDHDYLDFDLFSDEDGNWLADFGLHDFDLLHDMRGHARIDDDDGDATEYNIHSFQPAIWARPHAERVEAVDFTLDTIVTLEVYDASDLTQTVIFSDTAFVEPAPHFMGPETLATFEFPDEFDLLPGHMVRVSDEQATKEVLITPLAITEIDANADIIYGVAEPFSAVELGIWEECCFDTQVIADEDGYWMIDLSGRYDLDYGTRGAVSQWDEDGDQVEQHFEIEKPPFPCEDGDSVSGRVTLADGVTPLGWATVNFEDFHTGEALYFVDADANGYYSCALPEGDYRVWAVGEWYSSEYYEETIFEHATPVQVTEGASISGVDFTLDTPFFVWEHLTFNLEDPVTSDIAVRQAIAFGTDRLAMIAATFPASPLLDSYLPPDHWAYTGEGLMQYEFDPDLARMILKQAGWVDEDGDGVRERDGQRLHILYVTNLAEHRQQIIEIFVANMTDIGVEVDVWANPNPWDRILNEHDFSVAQFAWGNDVNGEFGGDVPWNIFACNEYLNAGSYCNPTADQMLELLKLFGTRAGLLPFLAQHQQFVIADLAVLPLMLRVQDEPSPLSTFVALGQEGIYLKQGGTVVSGDVGANTAVTGPYLSDDAEVVIGTHVIFLNATSRIMGDSLRIKENAQVYDLYYNTLDLDGNTTVLGSTYSPLELPLAPSFPELPDFVPGTQDVDVSKNDSLTLEAGSYGLLAASKGATIIFTGGVYDFAEWDIGQDVYLYFEAPSEIRVAGKVQVDKGSYVGPAPGAEGVGAADIVFYIMGVNGHDGDLNASPKTAVFGLDNTINANIFVPNGTLHIRQGSDAIGAFLGKWVLIGNDVTLTLASGW